MPQNNRYNSLLDYTNSTLNAPPETFVNANVADTPGFLEYLNTEPSQFSAVPEGSYGVGNTVPETPGTGFQTFNAGVGAFSALSNAYQGYNALKLGKRQFNFGRDSFNTNLANQVQSYNTNLEDRQRSRLQGTGNFANTPEGSAGLEASLSSYLDQNRLSSAPI